VLFHAISEAVSPSPRPSEPARPPGAAAAKKPVAAAAPVTVPEPAAQPAPEAKPEPPKAEPVVSAKPAVSVSPSTSSSAAFRDADGDLYSLAHEAHFTSHDYARALSGWNAYLRAAPSGRFATEARYNRALCLLRLGRDAEARQALTPFASGLMGYRQNEARELLDELSK
jgi:TolA-binding protein